MIVIYYIMQNSFEWQNWMIVNLLMGTIQQHEVSWEENTIFHSSICNWILFSGESFYKESNSLTIIEG